MKYELSKVTLSMERGMFYSLTTYILFQNRTIEGALMIQRAVIMTSMIMCLSLFLCQRTATKSCPLWSRWSVLIFWFQLAHLEGDPESIFVSRSCGYISSITITRPSTHISYDSQCMSNNNILLENISIDISTRESKRRSRYACCAPIISSVFIDQTIFLIEPLDYTLSKNRVLIRPFTIHQTIHHTISCGCVCQRNNSVRPFRSI